MTIQSVYEERCATPHNIDVHLPVLRRYAGQVQSVTEFGTDFGWSTIAFLAGRPKKVFSYDINRTWYVSTIEMLAARENQHFAFILDDTLTMPVIERTDLLFLDTVHTYEQVRAELARHGHRAKKYLVFHDIIAFPEIVPAIEEYTRAYGWDCDTWDTRQSGLAAYVRPPR